ncbi:MAG TPA: PP2C family protein-serine/threonine phosphatase [Mycobacteriales bacterium]|nr:PP2C family protein-serine/threonine phosphatase [Mycobacteriales bacterium]
MALTMVDRGSGRRGGPVARLRAARRRAALFVAPESPRAKAVVVGSLLVLVAVCALLTSAVSVRAVPMTALAVPVVLGGFLLDRPALRILLVATAVAVVVEVSELGWEVARAGSIGVLVILAVVAVELARDRERLGLSVGRGESMLLELRDKLQHQGEMPPLPAGWHADVAQRSAGGSTFGGDFIVSTLADGGKRLELGIVDVSGKGLDAGTRALLLSGALGGLLGAVAPERFLAAANEYLLRLEWDEGFATALHVTIDLHTGHYRLTSAGHPPAVHYAGGSGRWQPIELDGMVLGLVPDARPGVAEGHLQQHDALLLYTDGLVEVPGRDLAVGTDRLLGAAENLIPRGFDGGAAMLIDRVAPAATDDRAVVLLWRT